MNNVNSRFADVIIALKAAHDYDQVLGRIQLQKYIYLSDTISLVWDVLAPRYGHETYKHGPWDDAVSNAVDVLAFRGFVNVVSIKMEEKKVDAQYEINKTGLRVFEEMALDGHFEKKIGLYSQIAIHVNKIGWRKLRELVYAEPTYVQSRANGYGYKFDYLSLFSNESLRVLYQFESMLKDGQRITKENMVSLFFKLIS